MMTFPMAEMNSMAALRMGTLLMRQTQTYRDKEQSIPDVAAISADEDSQPMEREVKGAAAATFEFRGAATHRPTGVDAALLGSEDAESCYHLLAGCETIAAAIARIQAHRMPLEPDPELSHAGNMIYMMTGRRPTPVEERVMDVALILHADHGMNASTFAAMQVASTLSDIYFAVGAGIAALNGPLHGGANADSLRQLEEIGAPEDVDDWFRQARAEKRKVIGFGHRVYKTYDPRARILRPLAHLLAEDHARTGKLMAIAERLEDRVVSTLGEEKGVFPNVDFFSGVVYDALGIPSTMFTPLFAVARVAGWTARVLEYLQNNRIFRPRAVYTGPFDLKYVPLTERT
jgi:citrate synthase